MVDTGSEQSATVWPMPKFYFTMKCDSVEFSFQEVSGLDVDAQPIEYRRGNSPQFSTINMPGLMEYGNVTMKRGVCKRDSSYWNWYNKIKMNTFKRSTITISLLDEKSAPVMAWTLTDAWPTKITSTDLISGGNEVAIDTIEIAHMGLTIESL